MCGEYEDSHWGTVDHGRSLDRLFTQPAKPTSFPTPEEREAIIIARSAAEIEELRKEWLAAIINMGTQASYLWDTYSYIQIPYKLYPKVVYDVIIKECESAGWVVKLKSNNEESWYELTKK